MKENYKNNNSDFLRLIDIVHSIGSDQMEYFSNIALQRIKDESVYITDDCLNLDRGYQCGVEGLSNSNIIRWISQFIKRNYDASYGHGRSFIF